MPARSRSKAKKKAGKKASGTARRAPAKARPPSTPDEPATVRVRRAEVLIDIEERLVLDRIKES